MSPEEYQSRRAALLNQQQLEVADLDKRQAREQTEIEQTALTDWEVNKRGIYYFCFIILIAKSSVMNYECSFFQ